MALDHGLLGGVELGTLTVDQGVGRQVFHRPERLAVDGTGHADATVHGPVTQAWAVFFGEHHGAGAAIAFVAALLGAVQTQIFPK